MRDLLQDVGRKLQQCLCINYSTVVLYVDREPTSNICVHFQENDGALNTLNGNNFGDLMIILEIIADDLLAWSWVGWDFVRGSEKDAVRSINAKLANGYFVVKHRNKWYGIYLAHGRGYTVIYLDI